MEKNWMILTWKKTMILNQKRIPGLTVFGAISSSMVKPIFMIGKSTNKDEVL